MDLLQQSAQAWKEITEYRYLFTYGYKNHLKTYFLKSLYFGYFKICEPKWLQKWNKTGYKNGMDWVTRIPKNVIRKKVRMSWNIRQD